MPQTPAARNTIFANLISDPPGLHVVRPHSRGQGGGRNGTRLSSSTAARSTTARALPRTRLGRPLDEVRHESPVNAPARPGRVTPATSVVVIPGPRYCCDELTTVHRTAFRRDVWSAKFTTACSTCSPSVK